MMIDAAKEMCRVWGDQKRAWLHSRTQGWSGQSVMVKFREMHDGAGSGTQRVSQFTEEMHTGDGLLVSRALQGAPENVNLVMFTHYVDHGKVKQKAPQIGWSIAEYWRNLECAHYWIAAKLPIVSVETRKAG